MHGGHHGGGGGGGHFGGGGGHFGGGGGHAFGGGGGHVGAPHVVSGGFGNVAVAKHGVIGGGGVHMAPVIHHPIIHPGPRFYYPGSGGGLWHHSYCPPGGLRYSFRGGGYFYAPHHYSWTRWGNGWGWGCYGWWGGRYHPYRWGCHPYYGWGYWPYDVAIGTFLLANAVAASTPTVTTTTVITGTPVATGTNVMIPGVPTLQIQTPQVQQSAPVYQPPPPGFGFPFPEYDGKSDIPQPPSPDSTSQQKVVNEMKSGGASSGEEEFMTAAPKDASEPSKIDFDYSRPPSEVPYFAKQMKSSSSSSTAASAPDMNSMSADSSGGMGGGGMGGMSSSSSSSSSSSDSSGGMGSSGADAPVG